MPIHRRFSKCLFSLRAAVAGRYALRGSWYLCTLDCWNDYRERHGKASERDYRRQGEKNIVRSCNECLANLPACMIGFVIYGVVVTQGMVLRSTK